MSNQVVEVRGVRIGEGAPKIIIPITGTTRDQILSEARLAVEDYSPDIIEWRADWFYDATNADGMVALAGEIGDIVGNMPILFTLRTSKEGGELTVKSDLYMDLNLKLAASGKIDIVDIELFTAEAVPDREAIIRKIQRCDVKIIGSSHDFSSTPDKVEMVSRLCAMRDMGVDICKLAVMPRRMSDVFALIEAANEYLERYRDRPVIAISMSKLGLISRMCGELSAPGQIDAIKLRNVLESIDDCREFL